MGKYFSVRGRGAMTDMLNQGEVLNKRLYLTPNRKTIREVFEDLRRLPASFSPPKKGDEIEVWRTFRRKPSPRMKAKLHRSYVWGD